MLVTPSTRRWARHSLASTQAVPTAAPCSGHCNPTPRMGKLRLREDHLPSHMADKGRARFQPQSPPRASHPRIASRPGTKGEETWGSAAGWGGAPVPWQAFAQVLLVQPHCRAGGPGTHLGDHVLSLSKLEGDLHAGRTPCQPSRRTPRLSKVMELSPVCSGGSPGSAGSQGGSAGRPAPATDRHRGRSRFSRKVNRGPACGPHPEWTLCVCFHWGHRGTKRLEDGPQATAAPRVPCPCPRGPALDQSVRGDVSSCCPRARIGEALLCARWCHLGGPTKGQGHGKGAAQVGVQGGVLG